VKELPTGDLLCVGDYYRGSGYNYDGYIMKTDSLGNYLWHVSLNNKGMTRCYVIELGDSNSFYIVGGYGAPGIALAKFDSIGDLVWRQIYFTNDTIWVPHQIAKTYDSCFVIALAKIYHTDLGDAWSHIKVIKVRQKDGQLVWSKYFRHNIDNRVYGIIQLPDSSLVLYGMTGYSNIYDPSLDKKYGLLFKLNSEGDSIWSRLIHKQPGEDQAFCDLKSTDDKGFVGTGSYMDNSLAHTTLWLVKMDSLGCTDPNCLDTLIGSAEMAEFKDEFLVVYPNPVHNRLTVGINVQGLKIEQLKIYDITGKLVEQKYIDSPSCRVNVSNLPSGTYILEVRDMEGKISTEKLVKE